MCERKDHPNYYRCTDPDRAKWHVNAEGHERQAADVEQERHWMKPKAMLSMTPNAIRIRRHRAVKYSAEVDAMRTVHGVAPGTPIGPVLRPELWSHRYTGSGLALLLLAERFQAIAHDENVDVAEIAEAYANTQVRPHRQTAGERLAALACPDPDRPDWTEPDRLVAMCEPLDNGTLNPAYMRHVKDLDDTEFYLVTSFDGSEPMAWPVDDAGRMAAFHETLKRVQAIQDSGEYQEQFAGDSTSESPWNQEMSDADFLALSDQMHLV